MLQETEFGRESRIEFPANPYSGFFIAIEGLDGAGQSTQINLLAQLIRPWGLKVLTTKEPTNRVAGGMIRSVLLKEMSLPPDSLQLLFAADRSIHLQIDMQPVLSKGGVVLTDRYFWSSFAFGAADGVEIGWLKEANRQFFKPDVTIYLNVSPEACLERMEKDRFQLELFEEKDKLFRVYSMFKFLREEYPDAIFEVDGTLPTGEVSKEILEILKTHLKFVGLLLKKSTTQTQIGEIG